MLACTGASAAQTEREVLVADFTQALGIESLIDSSQRQTQQVVTSQREVILDNLRRTDLSTGAVEDIGASFDAIMQRIMTSWSAEEASRIYANAIASSMSDDDLKKSIAFYRSGEGQRSLGAAGDASAKLQEYVQSSMTKAMEPAMKEFMEKVRAISEADRRKRATLGK